MGAKWHGFQDPQSGIAYYEWRVGTSSGAGDIYRAKLPLRESAYATVSLHKHTMIYITVRAYNRAGNFLLMGGRKEMFYLPTHSTHFIHGYMSSDIW